MSKLDRDFKSQIAGIPGGNMGLAAVDNSDNISTTSSQYRRYQAASFKLQRHSVDAEIAKNSLENRLATGNEQPRPELHHMRSQINGPTISTGNTAHHSATRFDQGRLPTADKNFASLLRHSEHVRGRSESFQGRRYDGLFKDQNDAQRSTLSLHHDCD